MPALVAGIHVFATITKSWMAGTSPAMTGGRTVHAGHRAGPRAGRSAPSTISCPICASMPFGRRFKRMLASLDARGAIDPDSGLLANAVFWRNLNRAIDEADKRGAALSIARFSLPAADRRMSLEAARLVGRLMRQVDFACQEADKSIFTVFTETDLRAAHVVTRRIASVLRKVMLAADNKAGAEPAVTLATLKPSDTTDSLIARVVEEPPKPA